MTQTRAQTLAERLLDELLEMSDLADRVREYYDAAAEGESFDYAGFVDACAEDLEDQIVNAVRADKLYSALTALRPEQERARQLVMDKRNAGEDYAEAMAHYADLSDFGMAVSQYLLQVMDFSIQADFLAKLAPRLQPVIAALRAMLALVQK